MSYLLGIKYRIGANKPPAVYKILHFQGGGLLKFFPIFAQNAPNSGLLGKKSGGLFEFCIGGGLIKSGGLFAWIR